MIAVIDPQDPYFRAYESFLEQMTARNYSGALESVREGLKWTVPAVRAMIAEWGSGPGSIAFFETRAGAVAAMFNAADVIETMDVVASELHWPLVGDRYLADMDLMNDIRAIARNGPTNVSSVKRLVGRERAGRVSRAVDWLVKGRFLSRDDDGTLGTRIAIPPRGSAPEPMWDE